MPFTLFARNVPVVFAFLCFTWNVLPVNQDIFTKIHLLVIIGVVIVNQDIFFVIIIALGLMSTQANLGSYVWQMCR